MSIIVDLPDGTEAEFPDGTDPAVMKSAIAKRFPPTAPQAPRGMEHTTSSSSADPGAPEQIGRGLGYSLHRASAGLTGMLPRPLENALVKAGLSPSQEQLDAGKKFIRETGPLSTGGEMAGDVLSQALPISKLTKATSTIKGIPKAVANIAGAAGINSAMNAEDRGTAALIGGGSSVLGNTMTRLMGGPVRTAITPEAKILMDKGIPLTPGQMVTGKNATWLPRMIRATEDKAQSIPFAGDVIKERVRKSSLEFNTAKINEALEPLKTKITGTGDDAIYDALDKISNSYDNVLPDIKTPAANILDSMNKGLYQVDKDLPLLGGVQQDKLQKFIDKRVRPYHNSGADMTGKEAKAIDSELGAYIRQFKKGGPENEELSKAFGILRDNWRQGMVGNTPEAKAALDAANMARAKLEPLIKSVEGSNTGNFTPNQLRKQLQKDDARLDPTTSAGIEVLPNREPDSGTAGRAMLGKLLAGGGAATATSTSMLGAMAPYMLAGAGALGAYTKPGAAYMAKGAHPLVQMLRRGKNYDKDTLEEYVRQLTTQSARSGFNQNLGE